MAEFFFEGLREGKRVKGKISAGEKRAVIARLKADGIVPLEIREVTQKRFLLKREFHLRRPSEEDISFVLIQIGVLLEAGMTLARSLQLVAQQVEDQRISGALLAVKAEIERGESTSLAFRRTGLFPDFFCEMLTAAETGENLEKIFSVAGEHLATIADLRSRILNAVTYPAIVVGFSFIALVIALEFVVPRIAGILEGMGKELPLMTRAVILFSDIISLLIWLLPFAILLAFIMRKRLLKPENLDRILSSLPGIGRIRTYFDLSRFAYTLQITLSSAVPLVRAYDIASSSLSSIRMREYLRSRKEDIEKGVNLSAILKEGEIFPPLFVNLVETGENSGELERMLGLLADIYRRESVRMINLWTRMIEPISILIIGTIVGIIALSVILPLTEVTSSVGR